MVEREVGFQQIILSPPLSPLFVVLSLQKEQTGRAQWVMILPPALIFSRIQTVYFVASLSRLCDSPGP